MKWLIGLLALVVIATVGLYIAARLTGPQHKLASAELPLSACPESPNCVSSLSEASRPSAIEPLRYSDADSETAMQKLAQAIQAEGGNIQRQESGYLHATFRSALIGYIDDLEVKAEPESGVLHLRSSSRLGRSDFGVNRQRVEALRQRLGQ